MDVRRRPAALLARALLFAGGTLLGTVPAAAVPVGVWASPPPRIAGSPAAGGAGTVLAQPPNEGCAVISDAGEPQAVAENFVVSGSPATVAEVTVTGAYLFGNTPPPSDSFDVTVYPDVGGLPGPSPISGCTHPGVAPSARTSANREIAGFDLYLLTIPLGGGCVLAPGTYWIEIFETGTDGDDYAWECGDVDPDRGVAGSAAAAQTPGTAWTAQPTDHSLVIRSEITIFADGFESGDTTAWSAAVP